MDKSLSMNFKIKAILLVVSPFLVFYVSLFLGRYPISPIGVLEILGTDIGIPVQQNSFSHVELLIVNLVRLPRVILALVIGAGMAISGASFQGMFQNPLVSEDILGVSSAASFGGVLVIFFA